ncbi:MAG: YbjQ family protein [Actinobacteria bacterium]|nr:YbjQ family protein [Actinomycetota bacterium]
MFLTNMDHVPGYRVERVLGLVVGQTIRAKHVGKDIAAGLKQLVGGELRGYTEMMEEARNEALQRMALQASSMGANTVLNVRFMTTGVMQAAAEVMVYGTAAVLVPEGQP